MRTEIKKRVIEEPVYIADDGKEFDNKTLCMLHDKKLLKDGTAVLIEKFEIKEARDCIPYGEYTNCDSYDYYWYKINTNEERMLLESFYDTTITCGIPATICIEVENDGDCYWYDFNSMVNEMNNLLRHFDYTIIKNDKSRKGD